VVVVIKGHQGRDTPTLYHHNLLGSPHGQNPL
jgi:hypothetical protein